MNLSPASLTLPALRAKGEPGLFERDPAAFRTSLTEWFEAETGRTLYPDQVEAFLIDLAAYALTLHGEAAQAAVLANVAVWAERGRLDDLAATVGIARLPAVPAMATVRFTLPAPATASVTIPAGTLVTAGAVAFATEAAATIPAGASSVDAVVAAVEPGTRHNGFSAGAIAGLPSPPAAGMTAQNLDATTDGADAETDEHLREVVVDAPEAFDRRGGWGGYGLFVRRVSPAVTDVAVHRSAPGYIDIYLLTAATDPPGAALRDEVAAALTADTVRPMGDVVVVKAPAPVDYTVAMTLRVDPFVPAAALEADVTAAVTGAFAAFRRPLVASDDAVQFSPETGRLGAQVAPSALLAAARSVPGVVDVTLSGLVYTDLGFASYPRLAGLTLTLVSAHDV